MQGIWGYNFTRQEKIVGVGCYTGTTRPGGRDLTLNIVKHFGPSEFKVQALWDKRPWKGAVHSQRRLWEFVLLEMGQCGADHRMGLLKWGLRMWQIRKVYSACKPRVESTDMCRREEAQSSSSAVASGSYCRSLRLFFLFILSRGGHNNISKCQCKDKPWWHVSFFSAKNEYSHF